MLWDAPVLDKMWFALLRADKLRTLLIHNGANRIAESNSLATNTSGSVSALLALLVEGDLQLSDLLWGNGVELIVVSSELGLDGLGDSGFGDGWFCYIGEGSIKQSLDLRWKLNTTRPHQRIDDAVALESVGDLCGLLGAAVAGAWGDLLDKWILLALLEFHNVLVTDIKGDDGAEVRDPFSPLADIAGPGVADW